MHPLHGTLLFCNMDQSTGAGWVVFSGRNVHFFTENLRTLSLFFFVVN